jgi:ABC-type sugar transport system ATPase subunit
MPMVAEPAAAIEVRGAVKEYPGVRALAGVDLEVHAGEVHGLVGANGAGKSTLMKLVAGAIRPTAGTVRILGREIPPGDPRAAAEAGLAMIYQELTVIPEMSAVANVLLGRWPTRFGTLSSAAALARYDEAARAMQVEIPPGAVAGRLSTAQQQLLEVMRALAAERRVIVMDEPTASLGHAERATLGDVIRRLRERGHAIVLISHDLEEVLALADRITVMREGRIVADGAAGAWDHARLVEAMVGAVPPAPQRRARAAGEVVLSVRDLVATGVRLQQLELRAGEVLGIGGLVGSGRTELLRALAGAAPEVRGEVEVDGRRRRLPRTVAAALRLGVALAPEDRKGQGLVLGRSAAANVVLGGPAGARRWGLVSPARMARAAAPAVTAVGFDPARLNEPAGSFSGGNQQKLVLARWLYRRPRVLLLDEPTRGIDVGAKAEVFATMRRLADDGVAVVFVSSELEEVVEHADRTLVLAKGEPVAELAAGATVEDILAAAFATAVPA